MDMSLLKNVYNEVTSEKAHGMGVQGKGEPNVHCSS